ncbi:MmgE/PrpD family protein [Pollutimonas bauzanensis]|uniref:2-methylcitrate dehydratase PrpD n=1 Tax=Pollutimonas bauzanensis TaxID=658167 RepID=A0A1M5QYK4_9BURK|nr:MmgE/PrpD family protein [Pollutimonas bauzanensis]SHH18958.1 2-methylcitrate dehydratase PrpD [Pollutimonas bauzanensis]
MSDELLALGEIVAGTDWAQASQPQQCAVDQGIRASLLCALLGVEREQAVWPYRPRAADPGVFPGDTAALLGGLFAPFDGIGYLATLAGAADLDPMDPGPSHTVLPATLAACVARKAICGEAAGGACDDGDLGAGVLAGIEAGWRVRRAITGARPGLGFHSPGVFGTLAAAAAAARVLRLDAARCGDAMAIALTRASGLAVNSAASMIGMTHFGWGTLHGLEAALLAAHGWSASPDVQRALSTLFGEGNASLDRIVGGDTSLAAATNLVFKHYPCNIYANLLVQMLEQVNDSPLERIHIRMPWIPHLDCPAPRDVRQARNSVQAVAAVAGAGDTSYAAFSGPPGPWQPAQGVRRLLANIELEMDRNAPTQLNQAVLAVRAWRGNRLVLDAQGAMRDLKGWGSEHARRLMHGSDPHGGVDALYAGSYLSGYAHVKARSLATG